MIKEEINKQIEKIKMIDRLTVDCINKEIELKLDTKKDLKALRNHFLNDLVILLREYQIKGFGIGQDRDVLLLGMGLVSGFEIQLSVEDILNKLELQEEIEDSHLLLF